MKRLQMPTPKFSGVRLKFWIQIGLTLTLIFSLASASVAAQVIPVGKTKAPITTSNSVPDVRLANGGVVARATSTDSDFIWRTLQAIGAIIIIAGLGIGGVILVRKYAPGVIPGTDSRMKVLTRIPIGNRQNLIIVRIGERVLVVGSSPGRVECLSVVTDFEEVQKLSYGFEFTSEMARVRTETQENEISGAEPSDSHDVSNEIQWLRDRLDGYGDRVEGKTQA